MKVKATITMDVAKASEKPTKVGWDIRVLLCMLAHPDVYGEVTNNILINKVEINSLQIEGEKQ